jgi:hypothetical protein
LTVLFVGVFARFIRRLPTHTRRPLLTGGAIFLTGAAGLELVGRDLWEEGDISTPYLLLVGLEEVLEMLGVTLVAYALLTYLGREIGSFTIRSADARDHAPQHRRREPVMEPEPRPEPEPEPAR